MIFRVFPLFLWLRQFSFSDIMIGKQEYILCDIWGRAMKNKQIKINLQNNEICVQNEWRVFHNFPTIKVIWYEGFGFLQELTCKSHASLLSNYYIDREFVMGSALEDQQVACLWQNNNLLTVSLNGNINYLNPSDPSKPSRIIKVWWHVSGQLPTRIIPTTLVLTSDFSCWYWSGGELS